MALGVWILTRTEEEAKRTYTAELLWSMAHNDFLHYGGKDFRFPRYSEIFKRHSKPEKELSGEEIKQATADRLRKIAGGGEK